CRRVTPRSSASQPRGEDLFELTSARQICFVVKIKEPLPTRLPRDWQPQSANAAGKCLGRNVRSETLPRRDIVRYLWTVQRRRNIGVPDRVVLPLRRFDGADPVSGASSADQE